MVKTLEIKMPIMVPDSLAVIGVINIENGCCEGQPVLVTANRAHDGSVNYSCQCACGCWCTTGHKSASAALKDYEVMTSREPSGSGGSSGNIAGYSLAETEENSE